jgi:hypothetical protein
MLVFLIILLVLLLFRSSISPFTQTTIPEIIYYINLDHRDDRKKLFLKEMEKLKMSPDKIIRIPGVYLKDQGHLGCSLSHINALTEFVKSGKNNCIIFEDDFEFTVEDPMSYLQKLNTVEYDVVMLAANEVTASKPFNDFLNKVNMATTASGYVVSKKNAPALLQNFKEGAELLKNTYEDGAYKGEYAIDQYWIPFQQSRLFYVFNPKLGKQRAGFSDIQQGNVDYKL